MKIKTTAYILAILVLAVFAQTILAHAQTQQVTFNSSAYGSTTNPNFDVQSLNYNPYPVSSGEWFDILVQVQNTGQNDAQNVKIELTPTFPFSSNESLVSVYNTILGSINAYKTGFSSDASTVLLKYRVRVDDNAPEGTSNLNLKITPDYGNPDSVGVTTSLPVEIANTKTDFDIIMQDSTSQGTSFSIANIGQNPATAVTIAINSSSGIRTSGSSSSIIGNLANGDFTTVTFQIQQPNFNMTGRGQYNTTGNQQRGNSQTVAMDISYTDTAGVRNTIEKIVPISIVSNFTRTSRTTTTNLSINYLQIAIGIIIGIVLVFIYRKIKKKK